MKFILKSVTPFIICLTLMSCNGKKYAAYQCPMECQKDTVYAHAGKCPVCEMDLGGTEQIDTTKIKINNN